MFDIIPNDIVLEITKLVDFYTAIQLSQTSKRINTLVKSTAIYKQWSEIIRAENTIVDVLITVCKQNTPDLLAYMIKCDKPSVAHNIAIYQIAFRISCEMGSLSQMLTIYDACPNIDIYEYLGENLYFAYHCNYYDIFHWYLDQMRNNGHDYDVNEIIEYIEDGETEIYDHIYNIMVTDLEDKLFMWSVDKDTMSSAVDYKMSYLDTPLVEQKLTSKQRKYLDQQSLPDELYYCQCQKPVCRICHYKNGGDKYTYAEILSKQKNLKIDMLQHMENTNSYVAMADAMLDNKKYITYDNWDRPFCVCINSLGISIYTYENDYDILCPESDMVHDILLHRFENYIGYWYGYDISEKNTHGNTLLIHLATYTDTNNDTKYEYVRISVGIYKMIFDDIVTDYVSPLLDNGISYPIAYTDKYIYSVTNDSIVNNKHLVDPKIPMYAMDHHWSSESLTHIYWPQCITNRRSNIDNKEFSKLIKKLKK